VHMRTFIVWNQHRMSVDLINELSTLLHQTVADLS